jgi:hypothetical protein
MKKWYQKMTLHGFNRLLILLCGTLSLLLVYDMILSRPPAIPAIQPIVVPDHVIHSLRPRYPRDFFDNDLFVTEGFLKWMDSLKNDATGKRQYDSICLVRPGLLDSAREVERYYSLKHLLK